MRREDIQQEIALLDKQINEILGSVRLPELRYRPFPLSNWVFAGVCLVWGQFGGEIPQLQEYYKLSGVWATRLGLVMLVFAFLSTISWFFRGRGQGTKSETYAAASLQARELQERRRELQAELRAISEE